MIFIFVHPHILPEIRNPKSPIRFLLPFRGNAIPIVPITPTLPIQKPFILQISSRDNPNKNYPP